MNDDELITAVRASFTGVHSATPLEHIVIRSRAVRARRRVPRVAAALGAAAAVALAITATLPASHPVSAPRARLAAWTVVRQADGNILVTIRQMSDPAGLQSTLRADGVPVVVTLANQPKPSCHNYPFTGSQAQWNQLMTRAVTLVPVPAGQDVAGQDVMLIHPAGLPPGGALQISAQFQQYTPRPHNLLVIEVGLELASPQCTGS
jgi:hypothetical protein